MRRFDESGLTYGCMWARMIDESAVVAGYLLKGDRLWVELDALRRAVKPS